MEATGLSRFHSFSNGSKVYFHGSNALNVTVPTCFVTVPIYIKPWFRKLCLVTCVIYATEVITYPRLLPGGGEALKKIQ